MNCPKCGKPMEEGFMHTRNYPFWTQQELRFFVGLLTKWNLALREMIPPASLLETHFPNFLTPCSAGSAIWSHFRVI